MNPIRSDLTPLPLSMQSLPIDPRGYPVPWFVPKLPDGTWEFRAADPAKWAVAIRERRCWVCGLHLGNSVTFPIGPMCGINRTTAEPPCHYPCALWSAINCPFLSKPQMVRREGAGKEDWMKPENVAGTMIDRNPGVTLLWTTYSFELFPDHQGKHLIELGMPNEKVQWYVRGRKATRKEVTEAIESGLPILLDVCQSAEERADVEQRRQLLERWYPEV